MRATDIVESELRAARLDYLAQTGRIERFRHRKAEDQVFLSPGLFGRLLEEKGLSEQLGTIVVDGPMVIVKDDRDIGPEHVTVLVKSHWEVTRTYQENGNGEYVRFSANNSSNQTPTQVPLISGQHYSKWD